MVEVVVTRNHKVTLPKDLRDKLSIREGDRVVLNVLGGSALLTKRDPGAFREGSSFLPKDFDETLEELREGSGKRLEDRETS